MRTKTLAKLKKVEKVLTLAKFYSNSQVSTFDESTNLAENIIESDFIPEDVIKLFFKDFKLLVQRENDNQNAEIAKLILKKELTPNKVSSYKESHPISQVSIHKEMLKSKYQYEALVKLLKFSLLITPSKAKRVERGFSVQTLLSTKLHKSLAPKTLDKLMRLNLIGPNAEEFDWDEVVDLHKSRKNRHKDY